jgi:hypothetical protein
MNHYLTVMFLLCLNFLFRWNLEMTILWEEVKGRKIGGFAANLSSSLS